MAFRHKCNLAQNYCIEILGFNSYSVLSVKESFTQQSPEAIEAVIKAYEQARKWAKANPEKLAELLARESKLPLNVAKLQLSCTNFDQNIPSGQTDYRITKVGGILNEEDLVRKGTNVNQVVTQLFKPQYAQRVVANNDQVSRELFQPIVVKKSSSFQLKLKRFSKRSPFQRSY